MKKNRMISGIQASGKLTLGNYLGAISKFVDYQEDYELYLFIANLHSLTTNLLSPEELRIYQKEILLHYLASGIDTKKTCIFLQSDVLEHTMLGHILLCNSNIGELSRMTQYKDKSQNKQQNKTINIPTGLLTYPTLMAADILLYNAKYIPVGEDQKQHLELTRDLALRFNKKYGNTFIVPEVLIPKYTSKIMDLQTPNKKMSKSNSDDSGIIRLLDPIEVSITKIKKAKTDSLNKVQFNLTGQPGITNLINIYFGLYNSKLSNNKKKITISEICKKYTNKNYGVFKNDIIILLENFLKIYHSNYKKFDNKKILKNILEEGRNKATEIAHEKLIKVKNKIGLL